MADDLPMDVRDRLAQQFTECATALDEDDLATARETVESAQSVARDELPESDLRAHLLHGCSRVSVLLDPDEGELEADAASEYVAAMQRRLPDHDGS